MGVILWGLGQWSPSRASALSLAMGGCPFFPHCRPRAGPGGLRAASRLQALLLCGRAARQPWGALPGTGTLICLGRRSGSEAAAL